MKKTVNAKHRMFLAFIVTIVLFISISVKPLAAETSVQIDGYRITTTATHTSSSATGKIVAKYISGPAVNPPSTGVYVTARTSTGAVCGSASNTGGLDCSATAYTYQPPVSYSYVNSTWLGSYVCYDFHD